MKNFSKLFLASLLAGSLIMTGCGGENPTSADVSGNGSTDTSTSTSTDKEKNPEAVSNTICGSIFSTTSENQPLQGKNVTIELIDVISGKTVKGPTTFNKGSYGFDKVPNGFYTIQASGDGYEKTVMSKYIKESDEAFHISMLPTNPETETIIPLNFKGKLLDESLGYEVSAASIEVKNILTSNIIYTTTRFANGDFFINGISSGTYSVTFNKGGFRETNTKLSINEKSITFYGITICNDGNFTDNLISYKDSANNNREGYQLPNVGISVDLTNSGAIGGVLKKLGPNKTFDLYRRITNTVDSPLNFVTQVITNDMSEFIVSGLQEGYYTAVPADTPAPGNTGTSDAPVYEFTCEKYFAEQPVTIGKTLPIN